MTERSTCAGSAPASRQAGSLSSVARRRAAAAVGGGVRPAPRGATDSSREDGAARFVEVGHRGASVPDGSARPLLRMAAGDPRQVIEELPELPPRVDKAGGEQGHLEAVPDHAGP